MGQPLRPTKVLWPLPILAPMTALTKLNLLRLRLWIRPNSADTGRYNVDLVGKASEATEFLADTEDATNDADDRPELVFSFDDDDIYLDNTKDEGRVITMDAFRTLLKDSTTASGNEVEVLTYNVDGTSTFSVKAGSS